MVQTKVKDFDCFKSQEYVVQSYFSHLNQGQFELTSALFSPQGRLFPPFESPITGRDAIAQYLKQEAVDMHFYPRFESYHTLEDGSKSVEVRGKVSTAAFRVNVVWEFLLSPVGEIDSVKVNLLASLQELLNLRP